MTQIPQKGDKHDHDLVTRPCADYTERNNRYRFLRDAYTGAGGFAPWLGDFSSYTGSSGEKLPARTYLRRYPREPEIKWQRRVKNAYLPNYLRWIINIWTGLLTRETPARDQYPDKATEWVDKVTPQGDSLDGAVASIYLPWYLVYGEIYALVQRGPDTGEAVSAVQATGDVYLSPIHPDAVLEAPTDASGELLYIKYWADLPAGSDPLTADQRDGRRLWILTRAGWWCYDVQRDNPPSKLTVVDSGSWGAPIQGRVPVAHLHQPQQQYSHVFYMAQSLLRLYNTLSMLGEIEDLSCFPVLSWPCRSPDEIKQMDWGTATAVPYPDQSKHAPGYVGYDVAPAEHLRQRAQDLIVEIKQLSALIMDGSTGATGVAKAYSFLQTDRSIVSLVSPLERFDLSVCDLALRWLGDARGLPDTADAGYPRSFDVQEVSESLDGAQKLLDLEIGPVASRITKRAAIHKVHSNLSSDQVKDIDAELEDQQQAAAGGDAGDWDPDNDPDNEPDSPVVPPKPRVVIQAH